MPKRSLDRDAALTAIAHSTLRCSGDQPESMGSRLSAQNVDFQRLEHAYVNRLIDWQRAAVLLGMSKSKLYHWFRDTYRRQQKQAICEQHKASIEKQIAAEFASTGVLDGASKEKIWCQWREVYDISVFSVLYNNTRAKVLRGTTTLDACAHVFSLQIEDQKIAAEYQRCLEQLMQ